MSESNPPETLDITIDGKPYTILPMRFKQIKLAYKAMAKLDLLAAESQGKNRDELLTYISARAEAVIEVLSASAIRTNPELTVQFFDENMTYKESVRVTEWFNKLLDVSGFEMGEAVPSDQKVTITDPTANQSKTPATLS